MAEPFEAGQRIRWPPGTGAWMTVDFARPASADGWIIYASADGDDGFRKLILSAAEAAQVEILRPDGGGSSATVLAGLWTCWMAAATSGNSITALALSSLRPYAHQLHAVYRAMLPQPRLRFLLADEPGTGKTIMAGLYLSEMRRLGLIKRVLIVAPAGLVSKWQADFDRFFGGGLRRVTATTAREQALGLDHDLWVVSLELAAANGAVQDAIDPERAGWDLVIVDEAHRLTPTAASYYRLGKLLCAGSPRALLMTATPHRGSEWLFRHLLHLVDPEVYPDPGDDPQQPLTPLRPGGIHFLRRMKEDLFDYDGSTKLFKARHATNHQVPLSPHEHPLYEAALDLVDRSFAAQARPLARMVYGKRAASSLHALARTLQRRIAYLAGDIPGTTGAELDDDTARDEVQVIDADSRFPRLERQLIGELLSHITRILESPSYTPSKWHALIRDCLMVNGIEPGNGERAVIFTEYADTAEWIATRLTAEGYSARTYSGRQTHADRDAVRAAFMNGKFQVIVSTDAGNEGIDLQVAHVLVNYDIPWSLVRLEQRMGRIHRIGQNRDVQLYNLVAMHTREGEVLLALLEKFVSAANELGGQLFDSLAVVAELTAVSYDEWLRTLFGDDKDKKAEVLAAVERVRAVDLKRTAEEISNQEAALSVAVDVPAAVNIMRQESLDQLNPAIVEAYLRRLDASGVLHARPSAAGEGIFTISTTSAPPFAANHGGQSFVATTADAVAASAVKAMPLGPGSTAFGELVAFASKHVAGDLFRGGVARDPSSAVPYELLVFASSMSSPASRSHLPWWTLIRVDASGQTRHVRWECLANLIPVTTSGELVPLAEDLAASEARRLLSVTTEERESGRRAWLGVARRDLANLPVDLTIDIAGRQERIAARDQVTMATTHRMELLTQLCTMQAGEPRVAARLHVLAATDPGQALRRQSDAIAIECAIRHLAAAGWQTERAEDEGGYDVRAVRGQQLRLVAAKGLWESGYDQDQRIALRGDQLLLAAQHRDDYELHVVESCKDGRGRLIGVFQNPLEVFAGKLHGEAIAWLSTVDLVEGVG
jgi:superfamily II DNA or RNA helicase